VPRVTFALVPIFSAKFQSIGSDDFASRGVRAHIRRRHHILFTGHVITVQRS